MNRPDEPLEPAVQLIADLRRRNVELAIKVVNLRRACRAMQMHLLGCGVILEFGDDL